MADCEATIGGMAGEQVDRLVAGLKESSPSACGELYDRFARRLHRFIASRLPEDEQLVEELMLLTFSSAARNIHHFDSRKATFAAWLYGIASRHTKQELRLRSRRKSVPAAMQVSLDTISEQSTCDDLADTVANRLQAQEIMAEIRRGLSEVEMEVLMLHCVHQLSAKEVGQVLGRSERAIDSMLRRARQKARERMAKDA